MTKVSGKSQKINSARKLLASRTFILVTDSESIMFADFDGLEGASQLASLRSIRANLDDTIKQAEKLFR